MVQTQVPTAMVQTAIPLPSGYEQPGTAQAVIPSASYSAYPQAGTTYSPAYSAYVPAAVPVAPYPAQWQIPYAPFSVNKDRVGLPAGTPTRLNGYPHYIDKQ
ncbi:hypothetical protein IFM89_016373 [Coptis chinensis]|uniref:Uncharacterized protein n=1 Tax=Coptis chinensis TaxID=261450 RepID=A0A835LLT8_9MAGN|nr:hypothetical protein IFM89_016373 [Coptis chinensis]